MTKQKESDKKEFSLVRLLATYIGIIFSLRGIYDSFSAEEVLMFSLWLIVFTIWIVLHTVEVQRFQNDKRI